MTVLNFSNKIGSNTNPDNGEKAMKHAVSPDDPQFTITFNYEVLDDSFCHLIQSTNITKFNISLTRNYFETVLCFSKHMVI